MDAQDILVKEADRLRAAEALGRSQVLGRLFDFLLERSLAGAAPKEIEIAQAVFGRSGGRGNGEDASVRVAIHRLRRKLEAFYAGPGANDEVALAIPRGEYRIVALSPGPDGEAVRRYVRRRWPPRMLLAAVAGLLVLNLLVWAAFWGLHDAGDSLAAARGQAPWSSLVHDQRPVIVVLGDYYIFGEIDETKGVDRLVREYTINSPEDLADYVMVHPDVASHYVDLDLNYLPVGSAYALRDVMPLLAPDAKSRDHVHVMLASDLTPDMLKHADIIYIGYLSGLGVLRDPVFAGSRFSVGETYDELIDSVGQKRYVSEEGGPDQPAQMDRDYGYFSTFQGPEGNRIVVIAGTRDIALMQTAEAVTSPGALKIMTDQAGGAASFEALYEVEGIRRSNLGGRLLTASPLHTDRIWGSQQPAMVFPKG
jgi:hypothetical protein